MWGRRAVKIGGESAKRRDRRDPVRRHAVSFRERAPAVIEGLRISGARLARRVTLVSGTLFYRGVEGWSLLDSLYFSVVALTTVGYGDLYPTTSYGKVSTIFHLFIGVGLIAAFIGKVATESIKPTGRPKPEESNRPDEEDDSSARE